MFAIGELYKLHTVGQITHAIKYEKLIVTNFGTLLIFLIKYESKKIEIHN